MAKTDTQQDKYDALLLSTVQQTHQKVDNLGTEVTKQGIELKVNTRETKELKNAVRETNGNVKDLQGKVVNIEKTVFPETPPSELKSVWADPLIRKIIFVVGGLIILAALGYNNDDIRGLFGG